MNIKPLACPVCKCPLTPPAAQASGMTCQRCNTWLTIDPLCQGSCISCHKTRQEHPTDCIDNSQEIFGSSVVKGS
jgi:uncharacterized protein YbaR (Trm112 family)